MTFDELPLDPRIHHVLRQNKFTTPTPIQERAIPVILTGKDVVGIAQTGTGKTLAYILPAFTRLAQGKIDRNQILVLTPTRELAVQVEEVAEEFGRAMQIRTVAIYGGVGMKPQLDALKLGCPCVVATPGRLLDHMGRHTIDFKNLEILILDEADRMLDMGFMPDLQRIVRKLPPTHQTIMCSATWPDEIQRFAKQLQHDPELISVGSMSKPVDKVRQILYAVYPEDKQKILLDLIDSEVIDSGIIFLRTKDRTERIYRTLKKHNIKACVIHGDRSQSQRQQALEGFRSGKYKFLVATDVAARGLDIDGITHVINYDIPVNSEDYIHRIGRTARADADGDAITFVCPQEHEPLAGIERAIGRNLPRAELERSAPVLSTFQVKEPAGRTSAKRAPRRPRSLLRRR